MGPELGHPLWVPCHPFLRQTLLSWPSESGSLWTQMLSPTGNPSCPGEFLASTALGDVETQAVCALDLFSFHGKQNKTHTQAYAH